MNLENFAAKVSQSFCFAKSAMQISRLVNISYAKEPIPFAEKPTKVHIIFEPPNFWDKKITIRHKFVGRSLLVVH